MAKNFLGEPLADWTKPTRRYPLDKLMYMHQGSTSKPLQPGARCEGSQSGRLCKGIPWMDLPIAQRVRECRSGLVGVVGDSTAPLLAEAAWTFTFGT